jgi:hypothetical protein
MSVKIKTNMVTDTSTDTLIYSPEVERLVTTVGVTSEAKNSNSLLHVH